MTGTQSLQIEARETWWWKFVTEAPGLGVHNKMTCPPFDGLRANGRS